MEVREIIERIKARGESEGMSLSAISKKIPRDAGYLTDAMGGKKKDIGTTDLARVASILGTSVAYLIGETDDPKPSAPLRQALSEFPQTALGAGAGSVLKSNEVALSIDAEEWGEVVFLLSEEDAVVLQHRMKRALGDLSSLHQSSSSA